MPVAGSQNYRNDDCITGLVPLHRAPHFSIIAIIGVDKIRADQEQDDVVGLDVLIDLAAEILASTDTTVMPGLNDALPLHQRELCFKLVP